MQAMIFAAGKGTRLKPLTDTMPKALLPLAGKTLLEWQIIQLKAVGINDIVINVHHLAPQIIDYIDAHRSFGCNIRFSDETDQLSDTGGGLLKAYQSGLLDSGQDTLACNVDILSTINLRDLIAIHKSQGFPLSTVVVSDRETQRYLLFAGSGELRGWTNRATGEYKLPHRNEATETGENEDLVPMAFSGMQIIGKGFDKQLEQTAAERGKIFSIIDAYLDIVARDAGVVRAYAPRYYQMMDVGKIEQLEQAEVFAQQLFTSFS